jgi:hypothetical protein
MYPFLLCSRRTQIGNIVVLVVECLCVSHSRTCNGIESREAVNVYRCHPVVGLIDP